jgi:pyruvate/2-oxoglutarate dehydrogenase complex dihydrolipoamide dehydrogenase (E3) component
MEGHFSEKDEPCVRRAFQEAIRSSLSYQGKFAEENINMARIAIVGAGAMGSVYAGLMASAGHEVHAVTAMVIAIDPCAIMEA